MTLESGAYTACLHDGLPLAAGNPRAAAKM
jgi:hypothetical protein